MSIRKKVRAGPIDVDFGDHAVVVSYATETYDESTGEMIDQAINRKAIKVPPLRNADLYSLAQEIVEKCKYIHASKVPEVIDLLQQLERHEHTRGSDEKQRMNRSGMSHLMDSQTHFRQEDSISLINRYVPDAELANLENYLDSLYEDGMHLKVTGAMKILGLAKNPQSLPFLAEHETLLQILSRELRENSKKSHDLAIVIVCIFLCFSHYSTFHPMLMQHHCGDVTMRVVEYESRRSAVRIQEREQNHALLLNPGISADERYRIEKEEKKYEVMVKRQNKLMYICLLMLLNLAEDYSVEKKMVNRQLPEYLCQLLDRDNTEILKVALTFIKKLSLFEENKNRFLQTDLCGNLVRIAQTDDTLNALLALKILYNLSFDKQCRVDLTENFQIIKILGMLLRQPPYRQIVLRLLYHFTMDEKCKSLITYHEHLVFLLLQLVVHFPDTLVGKDLSALLINLALHPRAAELMVESNLWPQVVQRVVRNRDALLCKVVRYVCSHDEVRDKMIFLLHSEQIGMQNWTVDFLNLAQSNMDDTHLMTEVLGTFANLVPSKHPNATQMGPKIPWIRVCDAGLLDLLVRLLVVGLSEDDVVLECVMLVGVLALDKLVAPTLAVSKLLGVLQDLLAEKQEDDEIVLQLLFTFHCLLSTDETREVIMQDTQITNYVMDLLRDKNGKIRDEANEVLEIMARHDDHGDLTGESLKDRMRQMRFELHNEAWCQEQNRVENGHYEYEYDQSNELGTEHSDDEFVFHWEDAAEDLADRDWCWKKEFVD